jgi:DNA-binding transcriptional MerR regulator
MLKDAYSKKEVSELLGETRRTIQFWTDEGIVVPGVANPKGRGKTRLYSRKNLMDFLLVRKLTNCGLSLMTISLMMAMSRMLPEQARYWDKQRNLPKEERHVLIIYDPDAKSGLTTHHIGPGPVQLEMGKYSTALVIDVNKLAAQLMAKLSAE